MLVEPVRGKIVDKLFYRLPTAVNLHQADFDDAVLAKPSQLSVPVHMSPRSGIPLRPLHRQNVALSDSSNFVDLTHMLTSPCANFRRKGSLHQHVQASPLRVSGRDDVRTTVSSTSVPAAASRRPLLHSFMASLLAYFGGIDEASAALTTGKRNLARTPVTALRRALPNISPEMAAIEESIEEVQSALRIPQKKPWASMRDNTNKAMSLVKTDALPILKLVPEKDQPTAEDYLGQLQQELTKLLVQIETRDADRVAIKIANSLELINDVQVLQAPALPYKIPEKFNAIPRLTGRATAEALIERPPELAKRIGAFTDSSGDEQRNLKLQIVLDGYNAPLTAGRFVQNIQRGIWNGVVLKKDLTSVFVEGQRGDANPGDGSEGALPLEFRTVDQKEPRWKESLDVQSGEDVPVLPMSVPGALAMARGNVAGYSDSNNFFFYLFDRGTAGLGGLCFDEGLFSVFGYVVEGEKMLGSLKSGDVLKSVRITSGLDRFVERGA
eukprot:gnl/MRDRNA2_/MRDRNA2_28000_c0_seq2.p1 gnl/MRDRNA2_/MRDRNA2_28000_c0~~gnl/MRDRNA2_/MRDRNA2_28000_c0_seq2.p1  ORF type:complete len:497 (-),score=87.17 gnl/MRDRNA2_/MRDRNA2_28000_c0_seq2:117-1607(-)